MDQNTITPEKAPTLPALFRERVNRSPDKIAYRQYDVASQRWHESTWKQMATEVGHWQAAFEKENLQPGDRVAIMARNSRQWVVFDQAALGLGLVTVPLYVEDRPDNVAYIINQADVKLLLVQSKDQWQQLLDLDNDLKGLQRIVSLERIKEDDNPKDDRLASLPEWLFGLRGEAQAKESAPDELASIVYTSGTTGRPKGVMLSHKNILSNAYAGIQCADVNSDDVFLSFLPLSHTLERTFGYVTPIMLGAEVAFARSVPQLAEDLTNIKPTVLVSVPRIYERVYGKIQDGLKEKSPLARKLFSLAVEAGWARFEHQQGHSGWSPKVLLWPLLNKVVASKVLEKLGGRIRVAICGGAALSPEVSKLFIGLGLPLIQGYGLTEASPVITVNRLENNIPASIGLPVPGVEIRVGEDDELQTRSDCVMLGYWKNEQATDDTTTEDGWLRTGDQVHIGNSGHVFITGRLKDIIVLANGEKVPPSDMEMTIALDRLFEQVMIIGEARPYLSALLVLNPEHWCDLADMLGVDPDNSDSLHNKDVLKSVIGRINQHLKNFPGYAQIRRVTLYVEPWTVDDGLLTPTLKVKRPKIMERFAEDITHMYEGHNL